MEGTIGKLIVLVNVGVLYRLHVQCLDKKTKAIFKLHQECFQITFLSFFDRVQAKLLALVTFITTQCSRTDNKRG